MSAGRICTREVYLADPGEPVAEAARRMAARGVGTLLVLDRERRPIGILTDRDVVVRVVACDLDPARTPVERVMTRDPRSVGEDDGIEFALSLMRQLGCRRIPVVDGGGRLVGLLSLTDVLDLLGEEMEQVRGIAASQSAQST